VAVPSHLQAFGILTGLWCAVVNLPFLLVGELWGTVWSYLNAPTSFVAERLVGLSSETHVALVFVCIVQGALVSLGVMLVIKLVRAARSWRRR